MIGSFWVTPNSYDTQIQSSLRKGETNMVSFSTSSGVGIWSDIYIYENCSGEEQLASCSTVLTIHARDRDNQIFFIIWSHHMKNEN